MNDTSSFLLINVGAPFLIGMAVGYFTKKALKVGLILLGITIVLFLVSAHFGIIDINSAGLVAAVESGTDSTNQFGSFLIGSLKGLGGVGLSGAAGFFVGLKLG